jgi:hypothetical protein
VENARPRNQCNIYNTMLKRTNFQSRKPTPARYDERSPLHAIDPARSLFASSLPYRAFADRRIFDLGPHRMQIVRRGDHRKQQNQRASQSKQTLQSAYPTRRSRPLVAAPQPVSRHRQEHPRQIEQQFHISQRLKITISKARIPTQPK